MVDERTDRVALARALSGVSRNTPRVYFEIGYTATEGNLNIDKAFQKFCYEYSNNEYLQGIALLLTTFLHYKDMADFDIELDVINDRLKRLEDNGLQERKVEEEVKDTF